MTMSLYSGTPGSGKSLHIARRIYYQLRFNKNALANFKINVSNIKKAKGTFIELEKDNINPNFLREYSEEYFKTHTFKEDKILLVIDECQRYFNSRDWSVKGRDDWIMFFSNHRKYGYEIILIAQFDRMLDRQIRSLLEHEFIHRKVSNFGIKGKALSIASGGSLFAVVQIWYPLKERISSEFFKYHKKYGCIYDTYDKFDR